MSMSDSPNSSGKNSDEIPISSKVESFFNNDIIKELLKSNFTNPKHKIFEDAVTLMSDIARILVIEATIRAGKQALQENRSKVTLEDLENVLPQLILDFP